MKSFSSLASTVLLFAAIASADIITSDVNSWNYINAFGEPNTATYGQTFELEAGDDNVLNSIGWYMKDSYVGPSNSIDFGLYIYEWDGTKITGDAVFESEMLTVVPSGNTQHVVVETGNLVLETETQYVWFGSTSDYFDNTYGFASWEVVSGDEYGNGQMVYINNGDDFGLLSSQNWNPVDWDLSMEMEFSAQVPEPATVSLMMAGFLGLTGMALRRKSR